MYDTVSFRTFPTTQSSKNYKRKRGVGTCRLIHGLLDYGVPETNGHWHDGLAVMTAGRDAELPLRVRIPLSLRGPRLS